MKPLSLEFCGINSFSEPAKIDFKRLLEFGLFGVFGDTGSGKSTILDCIGFALYGNVSRSRSGSIADIIHYDAERAYVNYEFEIVYEGERKCFRVERELKRKNATQTVKVFEREGEALHTLSEGVRESNALLEKIIGLEQKDFEKCIALPQGEFAQFVKSQRADRLKLVSRLFDLERYGEKLIKKANAKCALLMGERNVLLAKLESFADVGAESIKALEMEIKALEDREPSERASLERARAEESATMTLLSKRREAEKIEARLKELEILRPEMERLERELGRLERAQAVVKAAEEETLAQRALLEAEKALQAAQKDREIREERDKICSAFDEERAEEEIAALTEQRARAEQLEERNRRVAELKARLQSERRAYAEEAEKFRDFCYEREKAALSERLNELGSGDFLSFAESRSKAALLRTEYAQFVAELVEIEKKYPETHEDIDLLTRKYADLAKGERIEFSRVRQAYEEREQIRSRLQEQLLALEKQNGLYRAHRERLQQLQTEGTRLKEELSVLEQREFPALSLSRQELDRALNEKRAEKKRRLEERESARKELSRATVACAAAEERKIAASANVEKARGRVEETIALGKFVSAEEAKELYHRFGERSDASERVVAFRKEFDELSLKKREFMGADFSSATENALLSAKTRRQELEKTHEETLRILAIKRDELARKTEALSRKGELEKELSSVHRQAECAERLKKLLEGNKFMEFAAEEYLQNVAKNGSQRLLQLTSGRYFLRYDGGFFIGDNLGGGKLRGVYTLSGGETFLVSLSLALALSAEICFKSLRPIEFFFLDEGFGTLDERLVDVVMDSLEKLKGEHFSIGVISHVEALKHRIERKLTVEKATESHGSRIISN